MPKTILLFVTLTILLACNKRGAEENSVTPPPVSSGDTAVLIKSNVKVIDSTKFVLDTDTGKINHGLFEFSFSGQAPDIKSNDIIVGSTGAGYMRRISSVNVTGGKAICQTTQANFEDVFTKAKFSYKMDLAGLNRVSDRNEYDLTGTVLYANGPFSLKVEKGSIGMNGDWDIDFDIEKAKIKAFSLVCRNLGVVATSDIKAEFSQSVNLGNLTGSFGTVKKRFIRFVGLVPVVTTFTMDFKYHVTGVIDNKISRNTIISCNNSFDIGLSYANNTWNNIYSNTFAGSVSSTAITAQTGLSVDISFTPELSITFNGVIGPYVSVALLEEARGHVDASDLSWDYSVKAWLQSKAGIRSSVLGYDIFDYNKEWNSDQLLLKTPDKIVKATANNGDNQAGAVNTTLPLPIKVKVTDNFGKAESGVAVFFKATQGDGTIQADPVITNDQGEASVTWKMGPTDAAASATATIKDGTGKIIGTPAAFSASVKIDTIALLQSKVWTLDVGGGIPSYTSGTSSCSNGESASRYIYTLASGTLSFAPRAGQTQVTEARAGNRKMQYFSTDGSCQLLSVNMALSESQTGILLDYNARNATLGYGTFPGDTPVSGGLLEWLAYDGKITAISSSQLIIQSVVWGQLVFN